MATTLPEVWLRGPLPGLSPFLQPAAHALLQAREEVTELMKDFPDELLWIKPAGLASPAFHLQHLTGVLQRLFTYAEGRPLSPEQIASLKKEGLPGDGQTKTGQLVEAFALQVDAAMKALLAWDEKTLFEARVVGRAQLPSTVFGLLFHAAEHTMRHTGQLIVTARVLRDSQS